MDGEAGAIFLPCLSEGAAKDKNGTDGRRPREMRGTGCLGWADVCVGKETSVPSRRPRLTHSVGGTVGCMLVLRGLVPLVGRDAVVHEPGTEVESRNRFGTPPKGPKTSPPHHPPSISLPSSSSPSGDDFGDGAFLGSPGWPRSHHMVKAGLEHSTRLSLRSAGVTGTHHQTRLFYFCQYNTHTLAFQGYGLWNFSLRTHTHVTLPRKT